MPGSVKYLPSVFLCLVVLGISLPAAAQDVPLIEVSGGLNYLRGKVPLENAGAPESISFSNGWYVDLGISTTKPRTLQIVGQISMNRKKIDGAMANQRGFLGGVRLNSRAVQRTVLFGQFLAGGINSQFGNGADGFDEWTVFYTWQAGGGVSLMVSPRVGIRLAADFVKVQGKTDSTILKENFNMFRVAGGIVLPFGTR